MLTLGRADCKQVAEQVSRWPAGPVIIGGDGDGGAGEGGGGGEGGGAGGEGGGGGGLGGGSVPTQSSGRFVPCSQALRHIGVVGSVLMACMCASLSLVSACLLMPFPYGL